MYGRDQLSIKLFTSSYPPLDEYCSRSAMEVGVAKKGPGRKRAAGGGGRRRKQQKAIDVGVAKKVLVERELRERGGGAESSSRKL